MEEALVSVIYVQDTHGVGEARALAPAGDDDDRVARLDEPILPANVDAVLDALVNVAQPVVHAVSCGNGGKKNINLSQKNILYLN